MKNFVDQKRKIAVIILIITVLQLFSPVIAWAVTNGPNQPEFSSFEPVTTTDMVNEFSGDFTYNIPLLEVPGPHGSSYPFSLSYHSGNNQDEDASWVGYGWSLNPGAISRNVRGNPDDDNGIEIKEYSNKESNKTFTAKLQATSEVISAKVPTSVGGYIRYNTYKGWSVGASFDANFAGYASFGFTVDDGHTNFSSTINPVAMLQAGFRDDVNNSEVSNENEKNTQETKCAQSEFEKNPNTEQIKREEKSSSSFLMDAATYYTKYLLNNPGIPKDVSGYGGVMVAIKAGATGSISTFLGPLGGTGYVTGSYSSYKPNETSTKMSYGYLYSNNAINKDNCNSKSMSKMDYYKERYAPHVEAKKYLPIPLSTPDYFSVTGEGLGGGFRYHLKDIGLYKIPEVTGTRLNADQGTEATFGGNIEVGIKMSLGSQTTNISNICGTTLPNPVNNNVRFSSIKNGDIDNKKDVTASMSNDLGGAYIYGADDKIKNTIYPNKTVENFTRSNNQINQKKSTLVEFTTMKTMRDVNKKLFCYTRDEVTRDLYVDKISDSESLSDDAIGEYAIHTDNGKCYVYGLPVLARKEVTKSYEASENLMYPRVYPNSRVLSGTERITPYATCYLLTQILSPDYIDVGGDGPTADDIGGWIKFNYRRAKVDYFGGSPSGEPQKSMNEWYCWRIPYSGHTGDPNRISIPYDNTATSSEGEKQIYYLESIETKSHIAYFITNKTKIQLGQEMIIQGSLEERADAYEFLNKDSYFPEYNKLPELPYLRQPLVGPWLNTLNQPAYVAPKAPITSGFVPLPIVDVTSGSTRIKTKYDINTRNYVPNFMEFLERIQLHKKSDIENNINKSLKTVRFQFDYEIYGTVASGGYQRNCQQIIIGLQPGRKLLNWEDCYPENDYKNITDAWYYGVPAGLPNSALKMTTDGVIGSHNDLAQNLAQKKIYQFYRMGKLTLRKLWYEYEGVANATLAPYEFSYVYPTENFSDERLRNKYPLAVKTDQWDNSYSTINSSTDIHSILQYGINLNQKPVYEAHVGVDPWGNNRDSRDIRRAYYYFENYINQSRVLKHDESPVNQHDPAAWQLKVIKLPSGAEIRVQYEKHDYSYVQNRPAMGMVEVKLAQPDFQKYTLNVEKSLGLHTSAEKVALVEKINKIIKNKEKILFNFTVAYDDRNTLDVDKPQNDPNVEIIKGYVDIKEAKLENNNVILEMQNSGHTISALLDEYWHNSIAGIGQNKATQSSDFKTVIKDLANGTFPFLNVSNITKSIYPKHSFFRIPLTYPKFGGSGVRVKRVLMYNKKGEADPNNNNNGIFGNEGFTESIYGKEYIYKAVDNDGSTISSGVATNEPSQLRDENPLVGYMEGYERTKLFGIALSGESIDQMEGPLGESLLPAPSIGYSKIIVRDIHHNSQTGGGVVMTDYYTAKDFPFTDGIDYSTIDASIDGIPPISIPGPFSMSLYKMKYKQGYKFEINNMHGQIKRVGKYQVSPQEQNYDENNLQIYLRNMTEKEYIEYEYFKPGEQLPIFKSMNDPIEYGYNGVEMDITAEETMLREISTSMEAEVDIGIVLIIPPVFTFSLADIGMNNSETSVKTAMITKIINYPAVLKKTRAYQNGMMVETENIAFSEISGEPVITSVTDEFHGVKPQQGNPLNGRIVKYEIPAALYSESGSYPYKSMGQKVENQMRSINNINDLHIGDQVFVNGNIYYVALSGSSKELYDESGQISSETGPYYVFRSGKTNQLKEKAMSVSFYGVDINQVRSNSLVSLIAAVNTQSSAGVISSNALTYSNIWDNPISGNNPILNGKQGKWRVRDNYVYKAPTNNTGPIYGSRGLSVGPYSLFNSSSTPSQWVRTSTVEKYSQHGEAIEERDIHDRYTSAVYAHQDILPSIVAYNARIDQAYFDSFEDSDNGTTEDFSHTGKKSKLLTGTYYETAKTLAPSTYQVMLWTNSVTSPTLSGTSMTEIARNGIWKLFKGEINVSSTGPITISNITTSGNIPKLIDDVRIQPVDSKATCYVYDDKNFRLLAQFDDQHFALLYQYNAEGKLVRKLKETVRGTKTITETQYHTVQTKQKPNVLKRGGAFYSTKPE